MNEISKPNDILVSTILNPNASVRDLIANGINETNTGIYDKDVYKNSDFIKNAFTTKDGVFDDDTFNKVYDLAMEQYNQLAAVQTYNDLSDFNEYNPNDLYAPVNSKKYTPSYNIEKVKNPFRTSKGVTSLFGEGESTKSNRELAQMHKVWDSENEKWLDYTAEDQGFLGLKYLGRPSLVYATWDEDGIHYDPLLGRDVQHRKGEWKTDENGEFYTETAGNKELYGKEFVAYSDILSKEDSWINKIDFFDSDDKEKSWQGTMFKNLAAIAPFMVPGLREIWGGTTAAIALASVLPTFGKMVEGIALGDSNTAFTKGMNTLENYFNKFNPSYSDEATAGNFNFEKMADTVSDIFAQLYQMRAAASLSKLFGNTAKKAQKESFANFADKFGAEWMAMARKNPKLFKEPEKEFVKLWEELVDQTPEMKEILRKQSKLSQSLSLGYMALTSSSDVYADALEGGYDRRMAGFAGIIAAAGQYGIMMNNPMGKWFLDATTGYSEDVSRNLMKKALRPYYGQIQEGIDKIAQATTKEAKLNGFAKVINSVWSGSRKGLTTLRDILRDGGEEFWKRSIIEGVEEVTEEAVMDTTKAMFDFMSWLGVGKNKGATFDTLENTFSQAGLERYLMNLVGGLMGGALFELQGKVIQPAIDAAITGQARPEVTTSLIKEIRNGNTNELLRVADIMGKSDKSSVQMPGGETTTRGAEVSKELKNYIKFVEGIVVDNGLDLSDDQVLRKAVRDRMLEPLLQESGVTDVLIQDFNKATAELADIQAKINLAEATTAEEGEKKTDNTKQLYSDLKEKKKELEAFLNGENTEQYLQLSLQYLHPVIREAVFGLDKYAYTQAKYGVDYSSLADDAAGLSKSEIDSEYEDWKKSEDNFDKFRTVGVQAYDLLQQDFSKVIFDYVNSHYGDVRKKVLENLIRKETFTLGEDSKSGNWREQLGRLTEVLHKAGLPGATLEELLDYGDSIKTNLAEQISSLSSDYLNKILPTIIKQQKDILSKLPPELVNPDQVNLTEEDLRNTFTHTLIQELNKYPIETLNADIVNTMLQIASKQMSAGLVETVRNANPDLDNASLKAQIDSTLQGLGYTTNDNIEFTKEGDAEEYVNQITAPKITDTSNLDFKFPILQAYIRSNQELDGEVIRLLKNDIYKRFDSVYKDRIQEIYDNIPDVEIGDDVEKFAYNDEIFDLLKKEVFEGLEQNFPIEQIVSNWISKNQEAFYEGLPAEIAVAIQNAKILDQFGQEVTAMLQADTHVQLYTEALAKNQLQNPFYKFLSEYGMRVFDGDDAKLMGILNQESQLLSSLPNALEYIRQGVTKEAIDNFIGKLDLLDAIIIGTEDSPIDSENLISYNNQMRRYKEKWGGENAEAYSTVKTEDVASLHADLSLVRNKLQFLKNLIESNTESKRQENIKAQKNIEGLLLDWSNKHSDSLVYKDKKLFPDKSELNSKKTDSEKLALIKHNLYQGIRELVSKGEKAQDIVNAIFDQIGLNANNIFDRDLSTNGLSSDAKSISEYDLMVFLTTAMASDPYEFLYKYKEAISDEKYNKVPFFTQEYAVETAYSFLNDDLGIHNAAVNYLYEHGNGRGRQRTSHLFFVEGIAGAGKSSVVMALARELSGIKNIAVCAPKPKQVENLATALTITEEPKYTKTELLKYILTEDGYTAIQKALEDPNNELFTKNEFEPGASYYTVNIDPKYIRTVKDAPKVIFIDEITHFELAEIMALEAFASKYNIKLMTSGDTLQKGSTKVGFNIESAFTFKNPRLTISARTSRDTKKDNLTLLKDVLENCQRWFQIVGYDPKYPEAVKLLQDKKTLKYYQTESEFSGDKIVDKITVEDLKRLKKAAEGKTIAILTDLDADGKIQNQDLLVKLKDADITNYEAYSLDPNNDRSVQGLEADYVIIDDNRGDGAVPMDSFKAMKDIYTYLSRSLIGTLAHFPGAYSSQLGLINAQSSTNGDYSLPGLDQKKEIKDQKIQEISSIIGDFKPEEKPQEVEKESPATAKKPEKETKSKTAKEEPQTKTETRKKPKETTNPQTEDDSWTPKGLWGYGFYETTGLRKNAAGNYVAKNNNTGLDLDGLFPKDHVIDKKYINGYIKLKRLISLYPKTDSEGWTDGLSDSDILDFIWAVNPAITDSKDITEKRNEVYQWAIENLEISENSYIFAKTYDPSIDSPYNLDTENSTDNLKEGNPMLMYGRILSSKDGVFNQYIVQGTFPKLSTLTEHSINFPAYTNLYNEVSKKLKDNPKDLIVYNINSIETNSPTKVVLWKMNPKGESIFTSLEDLRKNRNIFFNENEIYLINQEKCTVNKIETFAFLHYMAEGTPIKDYANRIEQLEKAFVKDGRLTVGGKYFTKVSFVNTGKAEDSRVIILEPSGFSYDSAIQYQRANSGTKASSGKKKGTILDTKASAMSQSSQMYLLNDMFNRLEKYYTNKGENLSRSDIVKQFTEYAISTIGSSERKGNLAKALDEARNLITEYEENNKDFDNEFLSELLKRTRYFGILLMDTFLSYHAEKDNKSSEVGIRLPAKNPGDSREEIEWDFDLNQQSYMEFYTNPAEPLVFEGQPDKPIKFYNVVVDNGLSTLNHIGVLNQSIQMPKVAFSSEDLNSRKEVANPKLERTEASRENDDGKTFETKEKKQKKTTASFSELAKTFNEEDRVYPTPSKTYSSRNKFYKVVDMKNWKSRQEFAIKVGGYELRAGDTVQLFGDTTHTYHIKSIDKVHKKLELDLKDGKKITGRTDKSVSAKYVTNIISREIPRVESKGKLSYKERLQKIINLDYYQSAKYREGKHNTINNRVVSRDNVNLETMKSVLFKDKKPGQALMFIPVPKGVSFIEAVNLYKQSLETNGSSDMQYMVISESEEENFDRFQERLSNLEDGEWDGIAIVTLTDSNAVANLTSIPLTVEMMNKMTSLGWVNKYLATDVNDNSFQEKSEKTKKPKKEKPESKAPEAKPKKKTKEDHIKSAIESSNTVTELIENLKKVEIPSKGFFRNLLPKLTYLKAISEDLANKLINSQPEISLNPGDQIEVKLDNSDGSYIATIEDIVGDKVKVTREDGAHFDLEAQEIRYLNGIKYQINPKSPESEQTLESQSSSDLTADEWKNNEMIRWIHIDSDTPKGKRLVSFLNYIHNHYKDLSFGELDNIHKWTEEDMDQILDFIKNNPTKQMEELFDIEDGELIMNDNTCK